MHGDESSSWESDMYDYTVMKDSSGYFVYAEETDDGLDIRPTTEQVGRSSPVGKATKKGASYQNRNSHCHKKICGGVQYSLPDDRVACDGGKSCGKRGLRKRQLVGQDGDMDDDPGPVGHDHRRTTATTGVVKNLVILINMKNHERDNRRLPSQSDINILFNNDGTHSLAPTGSVKDIYHEISYGQLTIESIVMPWFATSQDERWYADGSSGYVEKEALLFPIRISQCSSSHMIDPFPTSTGLQICMRQFERLCSILKTKTL